MTIIFEYPSKANVGKIIPKNKIYEKAEINSLKKNLFIQQIDKITWKYKLSSDTINISTNNFIQEIQIFEIILKDPDLDFKILKAIDEAIISPIIFELIFNDKIKIVACYKRPNEADNSRWVISDYFHSDWLPINHSRNILPILLDLESLYEELLKPLLPHAKKEGENLKDQIARIGLIIAKEKELIKIEKKLLNEKQFNRKIEINGEIRLIKKAIEKLL